MMALNSSMWIFMDLNTVNLPCPLTIFYFFEGRGVFFLVICMCLCMKLSNCLSKEKKNGALKIKNKIVSMCVFPLIWLILCFKFQLYWLHEKLTVFWFTLYLDRHTLVANHFKVFFWIGFGWIADWSIPFWAFVVFLSLSVCVAVFGYGLLWICDFGVWVELGLLEPLELFVIVTLYFNFSTKSFWQWCLSFCKLNFQISRFLFSHLN